MGNWRNRPPRRINRQRNNWNSYSYDSELPSSESFQDNVPQWEKKFCYVIGSVPWRKVVSTKYFMSCHTSVINWDDSAVEETFQNAKKRFWSEMNGFPCEAPMPGPDIYIDEIDWNSDINPELMKELDREFFAPVDEGEANDEGVLRKNKKTRNSVSAPSDESNVNQTSDVNPQEEICNRNQTGDVRNNSPRVDGVSQSKESEWVKASNVEVKPSTGNNFAENNSWGFHENKWETSWENNGNPWERGGTPNTYSWKGFNGWGEWNNCIKVSTDVKVKPDDSWGCHDNKCETSWENNENPWEQGNPSSVSWKGNDNGWGRSSDKNWGWNQNEWNNTANTNNNNSWTRSSSQVQRNRGPGCGGRQWGPYNNNNRNVDFRGRGGGRWGASNESNNNWRRDDYRHDSSSYRNTRYRGDSYEATRGNNRRRVSFE